MRFTLPNFDEMLNLADNNPEELERLRSAAIEDVIDNAPAHMERRLRGLQFQIDAQRDMSKTPMASCIKISEMMHESFSRLRHSLNTAASQQNSNQFDPDDELSQTANVLPFQN